MKCGNTLRVRPIQNGRKQEQKMGECAVSRFATLLLKLMLSTADRSFFDRIRWIVLASARRIWLRFGDPIVEYELCGSKLRIPFSHELPFYRRVYPYYSENLGRIAAGLSAKYGAFAVIDIGANIGDSAAILHAHVPVPVLCIEGEPRFADLLAFNLARLQPQPAIERCFVGGATEHFSVVVHDGTAELVHRDSRHGHAMQTRPLQQVLEQHPSFMNSRLLKIDTDGMDISILNDALPWISHTKPVLFFEYDPDLQRTHQAEGLELLRRLKTAGYSLVLVYENTGDYMFSAALGDDLLFTELHDFFSGRHSKRYCDLCIFHSEDNDVGEKIRSSEINFFRTVRQFSVQNPLRGSADL
jgi:FkbM family methyltransferase